jgi:hypothetical protein
MLAKRPFGVTLIAWLVLMLIVWGVARCLAALQNWNTLIELKSSLSPLYLSVTGSGWGVAGGVLLWSLLTVRAWSRKAIIAATLIWLLEYWIERDLFYRSTNPNGLFALTMSIVLLGSVLIVMLQKNTQNFFTKSEAYEQRK